MVDRDVAHRYLRLKDHALRLAKAFDLSEASYQRLFDDGLIPLDQFLTGIHGRVVGPEVEQAFAQSARETCFPRRSSPDRYPTIDSIIDLAGEQLKARLQDGRQTLLEQLAAGGAAVQPVLGTLILPESGVRMPEGDGTMREPRFAPKTAQLVRALVRMGIFADDLVVYVGRVLPTAMRKVSYVILDSPRIGRQIAVCDQIGEITLIAKTALPVSLWGGLSKTQLRARPDIVPVRYNRGWIKAIELALLDNGAINPAKCPKVAVSSNRQAPLLTEELILQWQFYYKEKEGRWPAVKGDQTVWERNEQGHWTEVADESWNNLDYNLRAGRRGLAKRTVDTPDGERPLSLTQLRLLHGLHRHLSAAKIERWITLFHEKERRWPSIIDRTVWEKNEAQEWIAVDQESWPGINAALVYGVRSLPGGDTLAKFKAARGLRDEWTEALLLRWINLYHEKEGKWPANDSLVVWDRAPDGDWMQHPFPWRSIAEALLRGSRGLPQAGSVYAFRRQHGLHDDFSEPQIARWIGLFRRKTGGWPTAEDETIWDQDPTGKWMQISKKWRNINNALKLGLRGLGKHGSLRAFREEQGLTDTLTEDHVVTLISLFAEKEGFLPTIRCEYPVWDQLDDGEWVAQHYSWRVLDEALSKGLHGLPGGNSLRQLSESRFELPTLLRIPDKLKCCALLRRKHQSLKR